LAIGRRLVQAKAELRHGQYQHMVKHLLPFNDRHARRLRATAEHDILGKMDPGSVLPNSLRTRYELTKLPRSTLIEFIKHNKIHRDMSRGEVVRLVANARTQRHHENIVANARRHELGGRRFAIGVVDAPWDAHISRSETVDPYPRLTVEEICDFHLDDGRPLREAFAKDAILCSWVIDQHLFDVPRIFEALDFRFQFTMVWPKAAIGLGQFCRSQHELVCVGTRGDFKPAETFRRHSTLIVGPHLEPGAFRCAPPHDNRHSSKPDRLQEMIEKAYPEYFGPQAINEPVALELFARNYRPGWVGQGFEYPGKPRETKGATPVRSTPPFTSAARRGRAVNAMPRSESRREKRRRGYG